MNYLLKGYKIKEYYGKTFSSGNLAPVACLIQGQ
jgi:hypothetical protein